MFGCVVKRGSSLKAFRNVRGKAEANFCDRVYILNAALQHILFKEREGIVLGDDDVVEQIDADSFAGVLDLLG